MRFLLALIACLVPAVSNAWGDDGHRWLAEHALDALPPKTCVREWFAGQATPAFLELATAPDAWRSPSSPRYSPEEGPAHYLDIDAASPPTDYPREWAEVERRFGKERAAKLGRVPWKVEALAADLTRAFQSKNDAQALVTLALLSHYLTDAFSPLHATLRYNPRLGESDGEGLHERYEQRMLAAPKRRAQVAKATLRQLGRPTQAPVRAEVFRALRRGAQHVNALIAADSLDAEVLFARTQALTAQRWAEALTLLGSVVQTAWSDAGSPGLPRTRPDCAKR